MIKSKKLLTFFARFAIVVGLKWHASLRQKAKMDFKMNSTEIQSDHRVAFKHNEHFFVAVRTKPPAELAPPAKKSKRSKRDDYEKKFVETRTSSILDGDSGALEGLYKPKTPETKQTFEVLLSFIQEALGDQPHDVLIGAADEVLRTLKNDRLRDKERKKETEELLGASLPEERFALLVNLGKKITDFGHHGGDNDEDENIDETYGINVQFQESDEEEMDIEGK